MDEKKLNQLWDQNISNEDKEFLKNNNFERLDDNNFYLALRNVFLSDNSYHTVKIKVTPKTLEPIAPPFLRPYDILLLLDDIPSVNHATNNLQKGVKDLLKHWLECDPPERVKPFVPTLQEWAKDMGIIGEKENSEGLLESEGGISKTEKIVNMIEEGDFPDVVSIRPFELFFNPTDFFKKYFNTDVNGPMDWGKIMTALVNHEVFDKDYKTEETEILLNAVKALEPKQLSRAAEDLLALLKSPKKWCVRHDIKFPRNGEEQEDFQNFDFDCVNWKVVFDYLKKTKIEPGLWD